jgi:hypothetical protein
MVSLPAGQQRVLDRMETDLEGCEPRLWSMFAIFARLTRDEGAPRTESLRPGGRRRRWTWLDRRLTVTLRAVIAVPVVLGLVTLFVFAAINGSAAHGCRPSPGVHGAARTASCQSAQPPPGRS